MKKSYLSNFLPLLLLLLCTLHFPTAGWSDPYTGIYVFGDSLSDTGRLDLSAIPSRIPAGRFTNGYVWVEYLAETLNLTYNPATNFAVGGATTGTTNTFGNFPGLQNQIEDYLTHYPTADPQALYVIWAGANDILEGIRKPDQLPQIITTIVTNLVTAVTQLRHHGAEHIVVLNLTNLGKTPRVLALGMGDTLTTVSMTFNQALADALQSLEVIQVDTFAMLNVLAEAQATLSFTHLANTTDACVDQTTWTGYCNNPSEYLFWDDVHPTTVAHRVFALLLQAAVTEPYYLDFTKNTPSPQGWVHLPLIEITQDTGTQTLLNTRMFQDPHDIRFQFEVTYSNVYLAKPFQNFVKFPTSSPAHPTFETTSGQLHIPVVRVDDGTAPTTAVKYTADLMLVPKTANLLFEPTTFRLTSAVALTP